MSIRHIVLAFSSAKLGREDEFNEWYALHLRETLSVSGYVRAHRFSAVSSQPLVPAGRYLTIFEIEADDPLATYTSCMEAYLDWMTPSDANDIDGAVSWIFSPMEATVESGKPLSVSRNDGCLKADSQV
jgi:hypothetical protein